MLPKGQMEDILKYNGYEKEVQPSYTYKMDIDKERINGNVDNVEALKQAIYKEINTEADIHIIYNQYGIKKRDLFGKPKPYAFMQLQYRIKQKLMLDDRIIDVRNFVYDEEQSIKNDLVFSFDVESIFGKFEIEEVLKI